MAHAGKELDGGLCVPCSMVLITVSKILLHFIARDAYCSFILIKYTLCQSVLVNNNNGYFDLFECLNHTGHKCLYIL